MRARVPASSANLGPGFDALGIALSLYTEVTVEPADALTLTAEGEGAELAVDDRHLAVRIVRSVLGHDRVRIHVRSEIPLARGLASSSALIVAAAAAAGDADPLSRCALLEGHADNAAACARGGFVTGAVIDGAVYAHALPLDPDLVFVVVIPDFELSTKDARAVLPSHVPFADAVANIGRVGLLIAGLADHRRLRALAGDDRLHQTYRASLYPEAAAIMAGLVEAGALTSCWSGAGPTLLGVTHRADAAQVRAAGEALLADADLHGRVLVLEADRAGVALSH